jgi:hypothetical protein
MIGATVAMAAMAGLFVIFGMFALADTDRGCDGACGTCSMDCEIDLEGELR